MLGDSARESVRRPGGPVVVWRFPVVAPTDIEVWEAELPQLATRT